MKVRDLLINLLKYDIDLDIFLVNGNDLMSPSLVAEAIVKRDGFGIPLKTYSTQLLDNIKEQANRETLKPNAVILTWM